MREASIPSDQGTTVDQALAFPLSKSSLDRARVGAVVSEPDQARSMTEGCYAAVGTFNNSRILRSRPGGSGRTPAVRSYTPPRPLISYAPDPGFDGDDRLSYSLRNQEGDSARANVKIRVEETGDLSAWSQTVPQRR